MCEVDGIPHGALSERCPNEQILPLQLVFQNKLQEMGDWGWNVVWWGVVDGDLDGLEGDGSDVVCPEWLLREETENGPILVPSSV